MKCCFGVTSEDLRTRKRQGADRVQEKVCRLLFDSLFSVTETDEHCVMYNAFDIALRYLSFQN